MCARVCRSSLLSMAICFQMCPVPKFVLRKNIFKLKSFRVVGLTLCSQRRHACRGELTFRIVVCVDEEAPSTTIATNVILGYQISALHSFDEGISRSPTMGSVTGIGKHSTCGYLAFGKEIAFWVPSMGIAFSEYATVTNLFPPLVWSRAH